MPRIDKEAPKTIQPYIFHGLDLDWSEGDHAKGECPWCGREKFAVNLESGQWRCYVCAEGTDKGGGNVHTFLRLLHAMSMERTTDDDYADLAKDRGYLNPKSAAAWGVCKSALTGNWMVPGWNPDRKLCQLYVWRKDVKGKRILYCTEALPHQMFGLDLLDPDADEIAVCEGPWDGIALWETLAASKSTLGVTAVAGCGAVGKPLKKFLPMFKNRHVQLLFDSDHPRGHDEQMKHGAGFAAVKRAAKMMTGSADRISWLAWGPQGFDATRKDGWDVRDQLGAKTAVERLRQLDAMRLMIQPIPIEWVEDANAEAADKKTISSAPCERWIDLQDAWKSALKWYDSPDVVLSVMLAVAASTSQVGDQLFLQVVGDPGTAKTRLCEAMLVSHRCHRLEFLTGFHSGWKDGSGKEYSLVDRINHQVLITPEGDLIMSNPRSAEVMSQQRRIFDGSIGASYKNKTEDSEWTGLRTPWIMAITPAMLDGGQARLGDRFLKVFMEQPDEDTRQSIFRRVAYTALRSVLQTSDDTANSTLEPRLLKAYQLTGGYVDYLRSNASELIAGVDPNEDYTVEECIRLAEFTAEMRARPHEGKDKSESHDFKESPSRLTSQFVRLAICMAAVLNKRKVDEEVIRRVRKVAMNTSDGVTLRMVEHLRQNGRDGVDPKGLGVRTGQSVYKMGETLRFLGRIKTVEWFTPTKGRVKLRPRWRLTERMDHLCNHVLGEYSE